MLGLIKLTNLMPNVLLIGFADFIRSHTCLSLLEFVCKIIYIDSNINIQKVVFNRVFEHYQVPKNKTTGFKNF